MDSFFVFLSKKAAFYITSHERSGTHLAINLCYRNLYIQQHFYDLPNFRGKCLSPAAIQSHWSSFSTEWLANSCKGGIIKSHCEQPIFKAHLPPAPVVYILRDPRDTLVSFFRFLNSDVFHRNNPGLEQLRCKSFGEFLRRPLDPFLEFGFSMNGGAKDVVERWARHVKGWTTGKSAMILRYEEMKTAPRLCVMKVAAHVRAMPKLTFNDYLLGEPGAILPGKGIVGSWKEMFRSDDSRYLERRLEESGIDPREVFA